MDLIFATNNKNKLSEIRALIPAVFNLRGLDDIGFYEEIPEPYDTIEENASAKARYIYNRFKINCFADDTGLEVNVLAGRPGVKSARYAGAQKKSEDNIEKLLSEMKGLADRTARFKTVIALIVNDKEFCFEGIVNGCILLEPRGCGGFGYDSVFAPMIDGQVSERSFAEMDMSEKNKISHRAIAVQKLIAYLRSHF